MEYLFVAVGGVFGSLTRFLIGRRIAEKASTAFPIGTLIVNITGAFLLGVVSSSSLGLTQNIYTLAGTGFLGAYTTFSTFMYEGFNLVQDNEKLNAFVYILGTMILGIISYMFGFGLTNLI